MPKDIQGGFDTYWTQMGEGPRRALMIHCSLAHSGAWGGVARELSDMLTMTAYDLPGHGRSADWDNSDDLQGVCTDMAADLVGDDGPMDIIGHSFGATVALRLAVERPDLVRSLTLFEPVFFAVLFQDRPELSMADDPAMVAYRDAMARGDRETAAKEFTGAWGNGEKWDNVPKELRQYMADRIHLVEANNTALIDDIGGLLQNNQLENLDVPVLLMEGGKSPKSVGMINDGLARRIPNTARTVVDVGGHMAPITHGKLVAAEIRAFLDRILV